MSELRNYGYVCKDHEPKPNPEFFDKPFDWFSGTYCKLGFPASEGRNEYMWVKVLGTETEGDETFLIGTLDNDPVYVQDYKCGDGVLFSRTEICQIYKS